MGAPVVHFEILGQNGKALQEFYANLFGWKINADNPMGYGLVDTDSDGKGIGGGIGGANEGEPGWVTFYVEVDNLQAYLDKVAKHGGKTIVPITEIPEMVTFAVFQDPEGHMVGLVKGQAG